jgi:hypothetical protein
MSVFQKADCFSDRDRWTLHSLTIRELRIPGKTAHRLRYLLESSRPRHREKSKITVIDCANRAGGISNGPVEDNL